MNALGQLDQAFQSVKEFADQFSGSQEIRMMLVELLRAASREEEALEQLAKIAGDLEPRRPGDAGPRQRGERRHAPDGRPGPRTGPPGRATWCFSTPASTCRPRRRRALAGVPAPDGEAADSAVEAPPPPTGSSHHRFEPWSSRGELITIRSRR